MNKFILGGLALGGLMLLSKRPTTTTTTTTTPNLPTNPLPEYDTTVTENTHTIGGINEIDYRSWKRKEWAAYFQYLLSQTNDVNSAINVLFNRWYVPENILKNLFTNKFGLAMNLSLYRDTPSVGTGGQGITWQSTPIYAGIWSYWTGGEYWDCEDWRTFHVKLEQHYNSTMRANEIWLNAWRDERNWTQESSTSYWLTPSFILPASANCPTDGNCWFIEYFYSKGIDTATFLGGTVCNLANIAQNIVGSVENITGGIQTTTKALSVFVPVGIGAAMYFWLKKQQK